MMHLIQRVKHQQGFTMAVAWLCLVGATLLIVPMSLFQHIKLFNVSDTYTPYVFLLVLLSGSFLLTKLFTTLFSHFHAKAKERRLFAARQKMIRQLDFEEKAVLREFIIQRKNVLPLPMKEPAITNLLQSGVLVPAFETQEIKGSSRIIKLSIAIEAREQLTHKVLGLPVGKLTEEEAAILKAARPDYARSNYIAL